MRGHRVRRAAPVLLVLACVLASVFAFGRCASKPDAPAPKGGAAVVLEPAGRKPVRVRVEVARTEEERARGLMFRDSLASDAGMVFLFPETADHAFWMKNTKVPLDMIFIAESLEVVGVMEGAEPFSTDPLSLGAPSRYVLEVNAGFSQAHGVAAGARARFEGVSP